MRHTPRTRPAATLVETTFVLALALLFLFGLFEYGRYMFLRQTMENAAREGARFAVARTGDGTTLQDVEDYIKQRMAGRDKDLANYTVTVENVYPSTGQAVPNSQWNDAPFGGAILVRVEGDYAPFLPSFLHTATSFHVQATSMMASEAN